MPYCTVDEIRAVTGLTASELSDTVVSGMITYSTAQLNADIQIKVEDETVDYIGAEKENAIDGSNTTYYTKYYYIGDRNNDGTISGSAIYAYTIDSEGTRAQIICTAVNDSAIGKVTLASAPTADKRLYFTYYVAPVDMVTPNPIVKLACIQLASALCYTRVDASKVQSFRVGKVAVMKQSQAYDIFNKQYKDSVNRLRFDMLKTATGEKTL